MSKFQSLFRAGGIGWFFGWLLSWIALITPVAAVGFLLYANMDSATMDALSSFYFNAGKSAVVWTNDSLVFFYFREMAFKVLGVDLAKRLLGVGVIWPKDSLVLTQPWHQGVFCPDHPNAKESFGQIKNPKNSNFKSAFWA